MSSGTDKSLSVIALGQFAGELPSLAPRLAALKVEPLRCSSLDRLSAPLTGREVLLTELAWLNRLAPAARVDLGKRAAIAAGWIVLTDAKARFKDQVAWQRSGVSHFFQKPLDADWLAALIEDIHDRLDGPPVRAILVDDDESSLSYYGEVLRHAGIDALATQDPLLVLEAIEDFKPDLLLLDIEMPACRGPELATIVRQQSEYARLPVIFLTAMEGMQDMLLARQAAAEDFLTKPVAPELLVAAVKSHALRYRSIQRAQAFRLRQEARARTRLEQLQAAVDEHAIVSIADLKGNIVYANDKFCAISQYSREELLGQNHRLIKSGTHPPELYRAMWRTIAAGRTWHGEVCNRRKDGELYWVKATIAPVLDDQGKPHQYISIRTDITTQMRLEETAKEQELWLKTILDNIGGGVYTLDSHGRLTYFNAEAEHILGWRLEEIKGQQLHQIIHHHRPDGRPLPAAECPIHLAMRDNRTYRSREDVLFRKDGTQVPVHLIGAPLHVGGKRHGSVAIFYDATEEQQLQQRLIEAKEAAERANQAKSDFLSSMSHELRTPMNAILGFGQLMEYDDTLPDEHKDSVHEILKGGHHLLELINEVLDLAKIESGRIDLSLEPVELAGLAEDCRQMIQPMAAARQIALRLDVPAETAVRADRTRLKQVLLNLLSNAVKYNREGGDIHLGVQPAAGERMRIAVADTGAGIAPERMAELFQPFNRLDAEHSKIEGTGIGLTITRRLIELMGGEVGVDSQVGVGSTFWLELPSETTTTIGVAAEAANGASKAEANASRHRVLYIDDNPVNLQLVAQILGLRRHIHLMTAHTPELGIELALAHRPELILLDINMPGMDGYEVLNIFRADTRLKFIPVVAVTANAMPRDIERGRAAGFAEYLTKPLDVGQFLKTMDRCLASSEESAA